MEIVLLEDGRIIRPCGVDDLVGVSEMVLTEAKRSIADDFDDTGWEGFKEYLSDDQLLRRLVTGSKALVVQEGDDQIVGYLEISQNQVLLLFIAKQAQGLNLASRLLLRMQSTLDFEELYVNSSSRGYQFYKEHEFEPLDDWQEEAGVKFRPMKWLKEQ
ncbi:GNAT family N-acetyltransferase [Kiloniella antarctica]|uniref:GNAT family N-acetyltransferase n=1 Tax=Kiloniella antarctica TaxID=1550907 RepID=A0ABW5BMK0_9PROT